MEAARRLLQERVSDSSMDCDVGAERDMWQVVERCTREMWMKSLTVPLQQEMQRSAQPYYVCKLFVSFGHPFIAASRTVSFT